MITLAIVNFKGGVTKTSSVVGLGEALADLGHRVLLVDLDPQSHVAAHLGIDAEKLETSLVDVLERGEPLREVLLETEVPNLLVAPSQRKLAQARTYLAGRRNRDAILARALQDVEDFFDYILIDTPPDEGILSVNAMYAADYILIPTPLDSLSLTGIGTLIDSVAALQEAYEFRNWRIIGVVVNKFDRRLVTENRKALNDLEEAFDDDGLLFVPRIRADESVRKAQRLGRAIKRHNPKAKAAEDYFRVAKDLVRRVGSQEAAVN